MHHDVTYGILLSTPFFPNHGDAHETQDPTYSNSPILIFDGFPGHNLTVNVLLNRGVKIYIVLQYIANKYY